MVEVRRHVHTLKVRRKVAKFLNHLTTMNQTRRIKRILNCFELKYRQRIIHLKVNRKPLLFEATLMGNVELVNYLLDECGANVEQTGYWKMVTCTSLWAAAWKNFVHVVASLIEHGANVNSRNSSKRTAVSIVCRSLELVTYFVNQGADIHIPDCEGRTCLMYSIYSAQICQLLISNGAQVNQTDHKGKDALYFAIRKGELESVDVLIKNGADILRVGPKQNTPLELSVLNCKPLLVEYFIGMNCHTNESIASAYELFGSRVVTYESTRAKFYWEKALWIRNQYNLFPKRVPVHRNHQYMEIPLGIEFQTMEVLQEISINYESMWTQSLLIQFRILGPKHPYTINSFSEKFNYHIYCAEFEPGIILLECLLLIYASNPDPLPYSLLHMAWMLRIVDNNYDIGHAYNLTCLIIRYLSTVGMEFVDSLNPNDRQDKLMDVERYLIEILPQLDHLLSFDLTEEQDSRLNVTLYNLIRRQPKGTAQVGLLHLTICLHLSPKLITRLIQCGANIDEQDDFGNTAVHYAIDRHASDRQPDTLQCLVDHGCHVDITNKIGDCPLKYLQQNGILRNPTKLQCMAAHVIKKYKVPYANILSKEVQDFVNLH